MYMRRADSRSQITTMEQFYEDGDAAPLGRPNFTYQTYIEGVTDGTPVKVVKVADRVDYAKNEPDITPEPARSGNNGKGVNIKLIVLVAVLAVSAGIAVWRILKTVRRNKAQQDGTQTEGQTPEQRNGDNKRYSETNIENRKMIIDTQFVQMYNSSCTPRGVIINLILII